MTIQQKSVHLLKGNDWSLIRSQMLHGLQQTYLVQTKLYYLVNLSPNQLFLESCSIRLLDEWGNLPRVSIEVIKLLYKMWYLGVHARSAETLLQLLGFLFFES